MLSQFLNSLFVGCVTTALCGVVSTAHADEKAQINPETLTVIGYHEVTNQANDAIIPLYAVTTENFENQVKWLQQDGFHFISTDDLIKANAGTYKLPTKPVLLTVDDGYESFYSNIYPFVKENKIPVVLAVVGSWVDTPSNEDVHFGDAEVKRNKILTWAQIKEMSDSGYVEIASHSYNLHRGVLGNPQGNSEPAATTRIYDAKTQTYEGDKAYYQRIFNDLKKNNEVFKAHGIASPRVMVWPYGRYNMETVNIAKQLGMPVTITLDDGPANYKKSLSSLNRILIEHNMTTNDLEHEIENREQNLGDNYRPQKIMHVDLDYIYDKDEKQEEKNLGLLLDRIQKMNVNTVYLQAFSDTDANGSADMVYFPNRYIPMRQDLFNRVAWQIARRTQVRRVYAWMPLFAWELPKSNPVSKDLVVTEQPKNSDHLNMGYIRLSPFSPQAKKVIEGIYQDLGKSAAFNGILFHDDTTLSDYEDASPEALKAYKAAGLSTDLNAVRNDDKSLQKWTAFKTNAIDDFAMKVASDVRQYQPALLTARNMYAQVVLHPYAENWYSQSLEQSLNRYDFTAIMAMPYMEQAKDKNQFYQDIVNRLKQFPNGIHKSVVELQAVDWRQDNKPIPSEELADTIKSLYQQGVMHVGYYPDDPIKGHPDPAILRQAFDLQPNKVQP
ncbi:poly-beta-1,6-N-acetyl-D-glucosamine N-deacetylase PgaB [Acinetobacter nectaris]|uniref:poly-beta-1,6-N-acetyl-D-glucosamine N-deacetylase PgaB n=1 Tax=Acinetobacter nectaris TaxID=1219382 RepID=UPI001EFF80AD|nr:poly-beta-1,6-N-acetyl-D-glucosamine N-deacetylase PgaB [Acinetobacter nectaris]MCF8998194.1 poly-beta-1,6-N-acetyl-D-glucosamine N-deacetylase PgaB [Acinetobacter nectaris]MCF9026880.1 poly-beta-1,6-N-acetyl-D-glucosamine N-deacetylase PgaB [Acinetobacter nectaris]